MGDPDALAARLEEQHRRMKRLNACLAYLVFAYPLALLRYPWWEHISLWIRIEYGRWRHATIRRANVGP
jgi:hypothetical protein